MNTHHPSIEVHLAPPEKAIGVAVIVVPGGGNKQCVVGTGGTDIADWLNGLGIHAFIEGDPKASDPIERDSWQVRFVEWAKELGLMEKK